MRKAVLLTTYSLAKLLAQCGDRVSWTQSREFLLCVLDDAIEALTDEATTLYLVAPGDPGLDGEVERLGRRRGLKLSYGGRAAGLTRPVLGRLWAQVSSSCEAVLALEAFPAVRPQEAVVRLQRASWLEGLFPGGGLYAVGRSRSACLPTAKLPTPPYPPTAAGFRQLVTDALGRAGAPLGDRTLTYLRGGYGEALLEEFRDRAWRDLARERSPRAYPAHDAPRPSNVIWVDFARRRPLKVFT